MLLASLLLDVPSLSIRFSDIQLLGIFVGVLAGLIVVYKFVIKRPNLAVDVDATGDLDSDGQALLTFMVINRGRNYAEDVFILLKTEGWTLETMSDDVTDTIFPPNGGATWSVEPITRLLGDTEQHKIYLDRPVYEDVEISIATKIVPLDKGESYKMDYTVICKQHRPRDGNITIDVDEDGYVAVESNHPTLWTRIWSSLSSPLS